jgi:4-alpha-glucanotransferase
MSDDLVRNLAAKAGVDSTWRDQSGTEHVVSIDTLRAVLGSIGLRCRDDDELRNSLSVVELSGHGHEPFVTARVGQPVVLPRMSGKAPTFEIELEAGGVRAITPLEVGDYFVTLPAFDDPGYHQIRTADAEFTIATAPSRAIIAPDLITEGISWGLGAQIYSLRREGDGGLGDFGAVSDLARAAAARGADFLSLSPTHALFSADPGHYAPYSPSTRLFYNPVYADPRAALPEDVVRRTLATSVSADERSRLESLDLVNWPTATRARYAALRALHAFVVAPERADEPYRREFERFRAGASELLLGHAAFETLHAREFAADYTRWSWHDWAPALRDPTSETVKDFLREQASEVDFHIFAQWITGKSYADSQRVCRDAGMRIGLVADIAIGMEASGSHAWSRQRDVLHGVSIGAPPDYYNSEGQSWGLVGFSPRGLAETQFAPFIETLRAGLRYAGGIRIDHVMGMSRLWLVPNGARATEGAYLNYPSETLFRLVALESWRHGAIVIGEDLGTLPDGFRQYLASQGISGMRVLRFERDARGFYAPETWDPSAVAMTTTHDLISTAGWWRGCDIGSAEPNPADGTASAIRDWDRGLLWSSFERAGVANGERPAPDHPDPAVAAAISFIAKSGSRTRLLAVEDALALDDQPNVPGTTSERPNWRTRLPGLAATMLDDPSVEDRLVRVGGHRAEAGATR